MDFSYFTAAPQPYQFMGLPPTPTHNPIPDDFSHGSPIENYEQAFNNFDPFPRFGTNGLPPPSPTSQLSNHKSSLTPLNGDSGMNVDLDNDPRARSSSEEKENLTPAQSRRKAQNRAAQRAFRERKERHVKDLEQKLTSLEEASNNLQADNDRLKRELHKVATENKILKATTPQAPHQAELSSMGPTEYTPTDFYSNVLVNHDNKTPSHKITVSEKTGEKLLGAGATWDKIQEHTLFKQGLVDVGDVCERLKKVAKCDGQGPVFEEKDVVDAIEASAASGSDELI
ncbi:MAG: hypothetical protein M1827_007290 [Pycnora praestabilis]|nr:MAG: hypothetical protein M1827_007290 [Pycnora praestabilis]